MRILARRGVRRSCLLTMIRKRSTLIANNMATPTDIHSHKSMADARQRVALNSHCAVTMVARSKGTVVTASIISAKARLANRKLIAERMAARRYTIIHTTAFPHSANNTTHTISTLKNTCSGKLRTRPLTSFPACCTTACSATCAVGVAQRVLSTNELLFVHHNKEEEFSMDSDWLTAARGRGRVSLSLAIANNIPAGFWAPWQPLISRPTQKHVSAQEVTVEEEEL